ncbi:MAG: hypothetical protein ACUVQ0_05730 [Thermoproteota archaeon]
MNVKNHYKLVAVVMILAALLVGETLYIFHLKARLEEQEEALRTLGEKIRQITYRVDLLIKYGNGSREWFNNTLVPVGWSLFNTTLNLTGGNVDYDTYPFGVFITGIKGVKQSGTRYWLWYRWDSENVEWVLGETGADTYLIKDGDILAWYFADTSNPSDKP